MATRQAIILVILFLVRTTIQDTSSNQIDDVNPLEEAKAAILKEQDMQNIGGMLNNLMQSDGAKELVGNLIMNAATGEGGGQILQGLGAAMNLLQADNSNKKSEDSFDPSLLFSLFGNLMGQGQNQGNNFMSYLPMILQTINAFSGPEADERAKAHSSHAHLLPPIMEKVHLFFDHFLNTDLAKQLLSIVGAEKFVKVFSDENGKFSYSRMVDMLENHSFRKHWISMITNKIAKMISYFSDNRIQRKYLTTFQHFINSILKSQGYPKTVQLDFNRPVESISAVINYTIKNLLSINIDSKAYVRPTVKYIQELFSLVNKRNVLNVDQQQLSDKLADTINLEIIEPFARVNRGYRFAWKVPECDKYVMCLVNQEPQNEVSSLPGLRPLLSKTASLVLSWFLSSHSGTPFLTFYTVVNGDIDCQNYYSSRCKDFHEEEVKVTTEYVHNEL